MSVVTYFGHYSSSWARKRSRLQLEMGNRKK